MWVDFVAAHAQRTPNRIAIVQRRVGCKHRSVVTYGQLHRLAGRWATWLHGEEVTRGDRVALLANNGLEHLALFFACARLGAILAPLNVRLSNTELKKQLDLLEPKKLLMDEEANGSGLQGDFLSQIQLPADLHHPETQIGMDDCLLILFTSGSTGTAKGVMLHGGMILWNAMNTQSEWGLSRDDISAVHTPFYHTGGYNVTCLPLLRLGGTIVLSDRFRPGHMLSLLKEEKVSVFFAVPTMYQMMREDPLFAEMEWPLLRFCISGGAPCPTPLLDAFRQKGILLKQGFGLTEVGPNCFSISDEDALNKPGSIGRPMLHSRVKLIDDQGREVKDQAVGELCIGGPHVCQGYWRDEATFNKSFQAGRFHTGDLMRRDKDGFFTVVGRKKDMFISGGENVYPGEVVIPILTHPQIHQAVVVAVPDSKWGEVGYAFITGTHQVSLDDLRDFLKPHLSPYKHPRHLHYLESLPLLPNGKVDLKHLQNLALTQVTRG